MVRCTSCGAPASPGELRCPSCGSEYATQADTAAATEAATTARGTTAPTEAATTAADAAAAPTEAPPAGESTLRQVGEFRILRTIDRGGMGTVYEAHQPSMRRTVALKVLHPGILPSSSEAIRFEREAWIGGRLAHPNIVKVFSHGVDGSIHFFAMELVEGGSLHALIKSLKRKPSPEATSSALRAHVHRMVELFVGVAEALEHVHRQGVVHRDIKPLNLLLTKDGQRLLLSDFGLAREQEGSRLTQRGAFLGTVPYMSPEQLLAHRARVDHRTDIWSLGVSLYEAVTLDLPFSAPSEEAYISAVATKDPVPARTRNRAVSRDLETVLMKCLERDVEDRYASAAALKDDLVRILEDRPVLARRPGIVMRMARQARRRRGLLGAAALAALLAVGASFAVVRWINEQDEDRLIRWTLERSLQGEDHPRELQPDWATLETKLDKELRAEPDGELALLARKAAAHVDIVIPPFGLLTDLPILNVSTAGGFEPSALAARWAAGLEASWDGGEWRLIRWIRGGTEQTPLGLIDLTDIVPGKELLAGPHRLDLRASFVHLASAARPAGSTWRAPEQDERVIYQEPAPRALGSFAITLFEAYPEDFPRAVRETAKTGPLASWFRVDRARITRVNLPQGFAPRFLFEGLWGTWEGRIPLGDATRQNIAACVLLTGAMDTGTPLPIAAWASIRLSPEGEPQLRFPLLFGRGCTQLGPGPPVMFSSRPMSASRWTEIGGYLTQESESPQTIPYPPEDGIFPGYLDLEPSRDLAREAKWFEQYLGERISQSIQIELRTVNGVWRDSTYAGPPRG